MPSSHDIEKFVSILRSSKNIVAIAGAGLSAASGSTSELLIESSSDLAQGYQLSEAQEVSGDHTML
jgi:hypothetical protein